MLRAMIWLARGTALLGGAVLLALIALTGLSILGRAANSVGNADWTQRVAPGLAEWIGGFGPVPGDFELVGAGLAFTVFSFMPLCQLHRGHARVDLFADLTPPRFARALEAFWEVVLTAAILLITWRLFEGAQDKLSNGETTFILQFPVWWAYAASLVAACAASIVALYCAVAQVMGVMTGRSYLPDPDGASG